MGDDSDTNSYPKVVILLSGKRKSGKDFLADLLQTQLREESVTIRLAGPIKEAYARENCLDYEEMLSPSSYKENHRLGLIEMQARWWREDYAGLCEAAIKKYQAGRRPIWIVSDCRGETDVRYFRERFGAKVRTVRIEAIEEVRRRRGWVFTTGVDDVKSECGLDNVNDWDMVVENSGDEDGKDIVRKIIKLINP